VKVIDKNQTLIPPANYEFSSLKVEGAYFRLGYTQTTYYSNSTKIMGYNTVFVYLNDQGREVLRTENMERVQYQEDTTPAVYVPKTFWEELKSDLKELGKRLREILK
jgi:hypothetical protein